MSSSGCMNRFARLVCLSLACKGFRWCSIIVETTSTGAELSRRHSALQRYHRRKSLLLQPRGSESGCCLTVSSAIFTLKTSMPIVVNVVPNSPSHLNFDDVCAYNCGTASDSTSSSHLNSETSIGLGVGLNAGLRSAAAIGAAICWLGCRGGRTQKDGCDKGQWEPLSGRNGSGDLQHAHLVQQPGSNEGYSDGKQLHLQ